ncbi:MAG: YxeA family protein [Firmicutes bacterium]|nr:YxeA family protein [Bacillota bacterium]
MRASDMKKLVFAIGAVFLAILTVCGIMMLTENSCLYTKVDGSCMEETNGRREGVIDPTGGMKYLYTLPACNDNGDMQTVTFGSSRILREGAYLKLTAAPVRGVTDWEEVELEALPEKAREKLAD